MAISACCSKRMGKRNLKGKCMKGKCKGSACSIGIMDRSGLGGCARRGHLMGASVSCFLKPGSWFIAAGSRRGSIPGKGSVLRPAKSIKAGSKKASHSQSSNFISCRKKKLALYFEFDLPSKEFIKTAKIALEKKSSLSDLVTYIFIKKEVLMAHTTLQFPNP
jgi:hypothetical protein